MGGGLITSDMSLGSELISPVWVYVYSLTQNETCS